MPCHPNGVGRNVQSRADYEMHWQRQLKKEWLQQHQSGNLRDKKVLHVLVTWGASGPYGRGRIVPVVTV
jgi:hypothetical protein